MEDSGNQIKRRSGENRPEITLDYKQNLNLNAHTHRISHHLYTIVTPTMTTMARTTLPSSSAVFFVANPLVGVEVAVVAVLAAEGATYEGISVDELVSRYEGGALAVPHWK